MNAPNERELKELLTMHDIPEPPADLAERIKAEIPGDVGAVSDAGTDSGSGATYPATRFPWRHLALAASILVMAGGSFLAYRVLRQSVTAPELRSSVADRAPDDAGASQDLQFRVSEQEVVSDTGATFDDLQLPVSEAPAGRERDAAAAPAEEPVKKAERRLEEALDLRRQTGPETVGNRSARTEGGPRDEVESQLEALGYVAGTAADTPAPAAALPPPPPPPPPAPRMSRVTPPPRSSPSRPAKRVPIPDPASSESRTAGRDRAFNQQVERENAQIRSMEAEAKALERQLESLEEARSQQPLSAPAPSTGGTAEPNDAPYGDVFFEGYGTNPFIDTEDDARSTFGLDVDTGSYTVLRRYLHDGHLPPPDAIRVEELVNFFDYRDAPPEKGDFAIHAEGAPSIYGQGERYHLLRFNVHSRVIDDRDRKPADLTFVVDVSGSMAREDRLGLVKEALGLLLDQLRGDDRIGLVVYGSQGRVLLEPTADRGAIRRAIQALHPEGATNAEEGLRLAYELAERHRRRGAIHRVILCSDGVANVGRTSAGSILDQIRRYADQGVELTTVGFGMGNYNDVLMERLADTGNGRYAYVDSLDEARRIFVEGLTGTLQTIAAEARVQVEFNPEVVSRYRLLGYENRDIADERFRDDTVDAGEIGAGHTVTALYEIKLHRELDRRDEIGTLHLRWASMAAGEMVETSRRVTGADFVKSWDKASPALRLTSLVAELAEILKRSYWAREGDLDDVFRRAQKISAEFAGDRDVAELVSLVGRAADYRHDR